MSEMVESSTTVEPSSTPGPAPRRRKPWPMFVAGILFVVIAFISWYGSWFGRPLSDQDITTYLNDNEKPRHIQHALEKITERMDKQDESVKQWYPKIISLTEHPVPQIREWAAVTMGRDTREETFHSALLSLLKDEDQVVRSTAALWLVRFNDASGRPELVEMLKPVTLKTVSGGFVDLLTGEEGTAVSRHAPIARVVQDDGTNYEILAPLDSRIDTLLISDETRVQGETEVVILTPAVNYVGNALVALNQVGRVEDIPYIERYTRELPGMPSHIPKWAQTTIETIRKRSGS